jgi:hypothetical protein
VTVRELEMEACSFPVVSLRLSTVKKNHNLFQVIKNVTPNSLVVREVRGRSTTVCGLSTHGQARHEYETTTWVITQKIANLDDRLLPTAFTRKDEQR